MTIETSHDPIYNIGAAARRTGIKADRIRAWERRYGAVEPQRTETDRRLYSDADLRRLDLLRQATELGHRIGHIASLTCDELATLLEPPQPGVEKPTTDSTTDLEQRLRDCMTAIEALEPGRLETELERASFDLSRFELVEEFLVPLMGDVGNRWHHGELDPAQEHLATVTIRGFIGRFVGSRAPIAAPAIVITTPSGQRHELGAMLAASIASAEGWRVVYLGPDLPAASIARAAHQSRALAIALGITHTDELTFLTAELRELSGALEETHLLVGGLAVTGLESLARQLGMTIVADFAHFRSALAAIAGDCSPSGQHPS